MNSAAEVQKESVGDRKIRCLLAHPHLLLRQGISRLLQDAPQLEVLAEAQDVTELLHRCCEHSPDVVIADAQALGFSSRALERLIWKASPLAKIVFLSSDEEQAPHDRGARNKMALVPAPGAAPPTSAEQLMKMVTHAAHEGAAFVPAPELKTSAPRQVPGPEGSSVPPSASQKRPLTTREREVLKLLAEGRTVRSAASILGLSAKTVDAHKFNLMRKLGLHNKTDLVISAIQMGLLKVPVGF